jgi:pimeloyl-ACP methyl ester carboxylesterase
MRHLMHLFLVVLLLTLSGTACAEGSVTGYGVELDGFTYPYPVKHFSFTSQGQELRMGYMDVKPKREPNGQTVVLMHGKNFCGATWESTIALLADAGYQVVVPDQIGFCSSTKPANYHYSFQQLASNTMALLQNAGVSHAILIGHSTGGMLATRFALMYPETVEKLIMVNPIGLEDWKALGVPGRTVDQWYERELKLSADGLRQYEKSVYYGGRWKAEYDRWVDMLAGLNRGPGHKLVAWNSALIYDMIYTQPVVYEFPLLRVPTILMLGDADVTAIGSDIAPKEVKAKIGNYKLLGKQVIKTIPDGRLIEFPGLGHAPQMEDPALFHKVLLDVLTTR